MGIEVSPLQRFVHLHFNVDQICGRLAARKTGGKKIPKSGGHIMKFDKALAKYYIKHTARFIVWSCAIYFAILAILGQIPVLPEHSTRLIVILYIFIFASLVTWLFGLEKPPKKSKRFDS